MLLGYKDIVLQAAYSDCRSRRELSTEVEFLGHKYKAPVMPSNMACTINFNLAEKLAEEGYFYILHRFYGYNEIFDWIDDNYNLPLISISVGVNDKDKDFISELAQKVYVQQTFRVDVITIDVAHGHHILVKEMIEFIKKHYHLTKAKFNPKIIAGNVMTPEAVNDLKEWGADAAKVGLSMGEACTTYNVTGVGSPMFTTISSCTGNASLNRNNLMSGKSSFPVIADGGIRESGDVCKALVAGARMVMIGSMYAACKDSPAKIIRRGEKSIHTEFGVREISSGNPFKEYYGSASAKNKGKAEYVEGSEGKLIPMAEETVLDLNLKFEEAIQSCMSYAGVKDVRDLSKMKWNLR